jgi:hypothetical protein
MGLTIVGDRIDAPQIERAVKAALSASQSPIAPPPFLTITCTNGRGGMPSRKPGLRVDGIIVTGAVGL